MKFKFYQYDKCSTCRAAIKFLTSHKIEAEKIDITENPPSIKELKEMAKRYEGDFKRLFNTSGLVYREMGLSKKIKSFSEKEALELLSKNGRLVKRPFLISDNVGLVGFKEADWKKAIAGAS